MGPARKNHSSKQGAYQCPPPAPAEYYDEVTDEQLAALKELVKDEFKGGKSKVILGPAW